MQLGPQRLSEIALYRLGLASGLFRRLTPSTRPSPDSDQPLTGTWFSIPTRQQLAGAMGSSAQALLDEAEEICQGKVRLFGGKPTSLNLSAHSDLRHWTDYETGKASTGVQDIKFLWEPARFGWAVTLARAYHLNGNQSYAQFFAKQLHLFMDANPVNTGPQWASGQEAALRLISLAFAASVFQSSAPVSRGYIASHAERIAPTLLYARAQNNNHLLSEAVGLYTAGVVCADHPHSARWKALGWRWMNHCFQQQISENGTYVQHSLNYHRLMLQLALWANLLLKHQGQTLPPKSFARLESASYWLVARIDAQSGLAPNLGHNDGAYILPLAQGAFSDQRAVAQAASRAFCGEACFAAGAWDEMSLWFGVLDSHPPAQSTPLCDHTHPLILRSADSWAMLRAERYTTRPGQADQLHVDLFKHGAPLTLDAGTYQYNAPPPWENALAGTAAHNTVMVEGQDQMRRGGRFLWLDWAHANPLPFPPGSAQIGAEHDGYLKRFGILHRRVVQLENTSTWVIIDWLLTKKAVHPTRFCLHWLLPDNPWTMDDTTLKLQQPDGMVTMTIQVIPPQTPLQFQIIRAGETVYGTQEPNPVLGWYSPTYSVKIPALSLRICGQAAPPVQLVTRFHLA